MQDKELSAEIERLKAAFPGADENKLKALDGLFTQAAYERLYLRQLNGQAIVTGLVQVNPENAMLQRALPISKAIATHSASLTNILDKLCKHLATAQDGEDDDLAEFE